MVGLAIRAGVSQRAEVDAMFDALLPWVIETDMLPTLARDDAARASARDRSGPPEEVAAVVRFLCDSAPTYLTGECLPLRGGRL